MKHLRWWFAASVALNVVLAGITIWTNRGRGGANAGVVADAAETGPAETMAASPSDAEREDVRQAAWRVLRNDDLSVFAANLRAAGLSDHLVRAVIGAEIDDRFHAREAALAPHRPKLGYWQCDSYRDPLETKLARLDLRREKARLRFEILGADPAADDGSGLPPEKREMARMIMEDYDTMISEITPEAGAVLLPSEAQMLEQLQAGKRHELEELFTPQELTEYMVRNSHLGDSLRRELRGFEPTKDEFRAIFEARLRFDDQMKRVQFEMFDPDRRGEIVLDLNGMETAIKDALGEQRYHQYQRERDPALQQLRDLASRVGAAQEAAERAFDLRASMSAEAKRIGEDHGRSVDDRRTALADLGRRTQLEIQTLLGSQGGAAYVRTMSQVFSALEHGNVVELVSGGVSIHSISEQPPPTPPHPGP